VATGKARPRSGGMSGEWDELCHLISGRVSDTWTIGSYSQPPTGTQRVHTSKGIDKEKATGLPSIAPRPPIRREQRLAATPRELLSLTDGDVACSPRQQKRM
jgi:hypothetical protein